MDVTCILCLEILGSGSLEVFSDDGNDEGITTLIEKYFWFTPDRNCSDHRKICANCWNELLKFHIFYKKVQNAHLEFAASKIPIEVVDAEGKITSKSEQFSQFETEIKNEIKIDEDSLLNEKLIEVKQLLPSETKKKRGRPRVNPISVNNFENDSDEPLANLVRPTLISDDTRKNIKEESGSDEISNDQYSLKSIENQDDDCKSRLQCRTTRRKDKRQNPRQHELDRIPQKDSSKYKISKDYDEYLAENIKFNCCLCSLPLHDFLELKRHFRLVHKIIRGYVLCCGKKFLKRGILVDHIHTHRDPNYFKCIKCDKVLADRRCLEVHLRGHEVNKERKYQCCECGKTFFRNIMLSRHLLIHVPKEERQFKCPKCNKSFASNYIMKQHINNVHVRAYAKICDICGKSVRGREVFQRHLLEHSGAPIPTVQCNLCNSTFTNKYGLSRHMKARHLEANMKPQHCQICEKVSPNLSAHRRHMNYVHSLKRNHQCRLCDKAFKRAKGLKEHMATHTGEQLYTCPHCPKTFNSNANLHSHRKKMHRMEWEQNRLKRIPTVVTTNADLKDKDSVTENLTTDCT